ncbi:hypothetical protein D3C84_598750 [compost metagenome]
MGFGEAHGAGPAAFVHGRQIGGFQGFAGVGVDGQAGAGAQGRIQGKTGAGGVEHFFELHGEHLGHAHAAVARVTGQTDPTAVDVGGIRLLEAARGADLAIQPLRAFFIAAAVERGDQLSGDLGGFFENRVGGVGVHAVRQGRQACPQARGFEHFMEDKAQVAQWSVERGHG